MKYNDQKTFESDRGSRGMIKYNFCFCTLHTGTGPKK